jgi:hypothetical protein
MVYSQTLIDNFNDGSIDSAKWTVTQGPGATESGGTLNLPCNSNYPRVEGSQRFDLTAGIFASKLNVSGERVEATEFYIGAQDANGNHISALGAPNGSYITFQPGGNATFTNEVISDEDVGVGWDWNNGDWWGIGNLGSDNVLKMYNSPDGQVWNEMARCTVGGTFDKTSVGIFFMTGIWNGTTTTLTANFDDASYWHEEIETFVTRKVRRGGQWVPATPRVRIGGQWVVAAPKPMIGGQWDDLVS